MKIALIQMCSGADKQMNIAAAQELVASAVSADRPDMVTLPETWSCIGGNFTTKLREAEELPSVASQKGDVAYEAMRSMAIRHRVVLHGGSINERMGNQLFNTTVVFSSEGEELARYRKMHLFDADTPDGSGYRESTEYGAGNRIVTYAAGGLTVGCAICYDLRFAEQFISLRRLGADLIVIPSAFTLQTGRDHWEVLLRARAIETQCWIAAPAMWGTHQGPTADERITYGHSLLVDPWGHITASASDGVGWVSGAVNLERSRQIRAAMPVMKHRGAIDRLL